MRDNKVIRGKPIYVYKGTQYFEMPEKTVVKRVDYDAESNRSIVYCKKERFIIETLSLMVVVACVIINRVYIHHTEYTIRFNSTSYYYNEKLYLNLYNDEENPFSITVTVISDDEEIYTGDLSPGEYLISIPCSGYISKCTLIVSYETLSGAHEEIADIRILDRS